MKKKNIFICIGVVVLLFVFVVLGINIKINSAHNISLEHFPKKINSFTVGKSSGLDELNYQVYRNVTFDGHKGVFYYRSRGHNGTDKSYKFEFYEKDAIDEYDNISKTYLDGVEYEVITFGDILILDDPDKLH